MGAEVVFFENGTRTGANNLSRYVLTSKYVAGSGYERPRLYHIGKSISCQS
jgi:hypothetical protein